MTATPPASAAFAAADFGDSLGSFDVWSDPAFHVDALHGDLADRIIAEFFARTRAGDTNPIGTVLTGPSGAGKTHFLAALRRQIVERGGWFVWIDGSGKGEFWDATTAGYADALRRRLSGGRTQAGAVLLALLTRLGADAKAREAVAGKKRAEASALDLLLLMLAAVEPTATQRWRDVVRALALCDSRKAEIGGFAAAWLQGGGAAEGSLRELGFVAPPPAAQEVVQGLLWIMGLAGPTLIAVEVIDLAAGPNFASGLAVLHGLKRRAVTLVACREESWAKMLEQAPLATVFRPPRALPPAASPVVVERLISARMAPAYVQAGFAPPYPSFPFTHAAVASAVGLAPRELLQRCQRHQQACAAEGGIRECDALIAAPAPFPPRVARALPPATVRPAAPPLQTHSEIFLGRSVQIGEVVGPVTLPVELLPQHVAVLAGAGKGALLCRLIEEAALAGVPALVLDGAGDFARLGEPWPSRPSDFTDDDARKAKSYFERVDVAQWTPGLPDGRQLNLGFLPDFAALCYGSDLESQEARELAFEMAIAALEPYLPGRGPKAIKLRGLLADAFRVFAREGGGSLEDFVRLLGALPSGASRLPEASELGREIAEALIAAKAADPLFGLGGETLDPAQLFDGAPGKTRVSVIHLDGFDDFARAAFVNRLLLTLTVWIRNQPGPMWRLLVVGEAHNNAPGREAAAKRSTMALARAAGQGLGIVFASQSPRVLDPAIVALCKTQLYGASSTSDDAQTVGALMEARGAAKDDLARLKPGEFYIASETFARPIRFRAPLSLSRRTPHPLRLEELVGRARRGF